jgi:chromosome partitioning protein
MSAEHAGAFPGQSSEVIVVERDESRTKQPRDHVPRETSATAPPDEGTARDGARVDDIASLTSSRTDHSAVGASNLDVSRETSLDTPIAAEAYRAAAVLDDHAGPWPRPEATRVITVSNQKGGVGKTTSVVNIAAALAMHGLRVVVIDLDPQGNASTALGVEHTAGTPSTYEVLLSGRPLRDILVTVPRVAGGLRCAPATIDLAGAELELASQVAREYRLRRAVEELLKQDDPPDYVLIDSPPSLGLLTVNSLVAAREVLIPIQCEYYALEGVQQLTNNIQLVKNHLNPALEVTTVLLTMYDRRTRLADAVEQDVRAHFGDRVLTAVIPRNVRVSEAPSYGQSVMTYDPGSRGATSYFEAALEIATRGSHVGGVG